MPPKSSTNSRDITAETYDPAIGSTSASSLLPTPDPVAVGIAPGESPPATNLNTRDHPRFTITTEPTLPTVFHFVIIEDHPPWNTIAPPWHKEGQVKCKCHKQIAPYEKAEKCKRATLETKTRIIDHYNRVIKGKRSYMVQAKNAGKSALAAENHEASLDLRRDRDEALAYMDHLYGNHMSLLSPAVSFDVEIQSEPLRMLKPKE